jgi:hypothetical protein
MRFWVFLESSFILCMPACTSLAVVLLQSADNKTRETCEGWVLEAVTVRDARGFFEHCGYHASI